MIEHAPVPGVLSATDLRAVADEFGVDDPQVRRDHVISHALAGLSTIEDGRLLFFGGTALARTRLPTLRLSEDLDLVALAPAFRGRRRSAPTSPRSAALRGDFP